jgi:hypothetical protein
MASRTSEIPGQGRGRATAQIWERVGLGCDHHMALADRSSREMLLDLCANLF